MDKLILDTNIFLRFFVDGTKKEINEIKNIFIKSAKKEIQLFIPYLVIFEIYWVLFSFYKKEKKEIIALLSDILEMSFIEIEKKEILIKSLKYFQKYSLDLEDCFYLAYSKYKSFDIFSYDKDLYRHAPKNRKKFE